MIFSPSIVHIRKWVMSQLIPSFNSLLNYIYTSDISYTVLVTFLIPSRTDLKLLICLVRIRFRQFKSNGLCHIWYLHYFTYMALKFASTFNSVHPTQIEWRYDSSVFLKLIDETDGMSLYPKITNVNYRNSISDWYDRTKRMYSFHKMMDMFCMNFIHYASKRFKHLYWIHEGV